MKEKHDSDVDEDEDEDRQQKVERKVRRPLFSLIIGDLILIVVLFSFTIVFYGSLETEIYNERTAYLEEITGQIVATTDTISAAQWDFAEVFANQLSERGPILVENLSAYIAGEQDSFAEQGMKLLAFDENGRYYDASGHQAKWSGSLVNIDEAAPEHQIEITTLSTTIDTADEMVFVLKMNQPLLLRDEGVWLTHVAVVRNMDVFSVMFQVPSFNGKGENYIISDVGTRVYRGKNSTKMIGDAYNVLKPFESITFQFGGSYELLKKAVAVGESCSLEFQGPEDQEYYVTSFPMEINDWSLLSIVPAAVINVKMENFMNMALFGMGMITLVVIIAVSVTIFFVSRYRSGQQLVLQQEKTNQALRIAAQAAQEASQAKSVFLSHMSHDIRTPINGIMGMTDIAQRNIQDSTCVKDCLKKISSSSHHLLSLVNDVLDMSRIESGKVEIENAPFFVDDLLEGCYSVVAGQAVEQKIDLYKDFSGVKQHYLLGDELHLRQIFINILGNAIKFTPEGGEVVFLAEDKLISSEKSELTVVIRDTGIGISEAFQKKIFEPFSQADDTGRTKYKGTGLGMSIVKQLTDLMEGKIELHSEYGAGSTFIVRLILSIEDSTVQKQGVDNSSADLNNIHVLLVEDNDLNMEIACYILEDCGAQITCAMNGQEAFEHFKKQPAGNFDLILMDVMMPVMDGLRATRVIRSSGKSDAADIPIIAMTANAYAEDRQAALNAGMNDYLAKPIDRTDLIRVCMRWIQHSTAANNI